jgi:aminoglycoside phosphotransferase (APT) family kinase protein
MIILPLIARPSAGRLPPNWAAPGRRSIAGSSGGRDFSRTKTVRHAGAAPMPAERSAADEHAEDGAALVAPPTEERLDLTRLEPFLRANLPKTEGPLTTFRFAGGHANLTYLLRFGDGEEYILRRPPLGPIPPGAHDMKREHRVLSRLHPAFKLAPRSLLLCEDDSLIGAIFVITERRRGLNILLDMPERYRGQPALNRRIGDMLIDRLVELHRVDAEAVGLGDLGRPEGFVQRQLEGWAKRWAAALDHPYPQTEPLLAWLRRGLPKPQGAGIVHNDWKLDNLLLDPADPATPTAVLDWDMCSRGDPLLDLGYLLNYWAEPADPPPWIAAAAMPTWYPGFPTRAEAIARYAAASGLDLSGIGWYQVFTAFKLAVIIQQIYIRYLRGQTTDQRFADYGQRVATLIDKAMVMTHT